jgi:hypothetical protein
MKFIQKGVEAAETVEFTSYIDGDGDFVVTADGVKLGFFDSDNGGAFERFYIDEDERERLSAKGFEFDGNLVRTA